jgi:uncharacterized protein (DUF983 family)
MFNFMGKRNGLMAGTYNRCPDCGNLRKRYMPLGDKKVCPACYEEYAGSAWIKEQKEKNV